MVPIACLMRKKSRGSQGLFGSVSDLVGWVERSETHHLDAGHEADGFRFALPILQMPWPLSPTSRNPALSDPASASAHRNAAAPAMGPCRDDRRGNRAWSFRPP